MKPFIIAIVTICVMIISLPLMVDMLVAHALKE
jgi:hypothetical protein